MATRHSMGVRIVLLSVLTGVACYGPDGAGFRAEAPAEGVARRADSGYVSGDDRSALDAKVAADPAPGSQWGEPSPAPRAEPDAPQRMRIYSGSLTVLVPGVEDAVRRAIELVEAQGGFLQSRDGGRVSLRVPAAKYASMMSTLETFGKVTHRAEQTEDVTRQYFDLKIRLENAQESRRRLIDLLAKATDVKAILEIEQELRRLTDEIESFEMELRNIEHQVAYSRIECAFTAEVVAPPSRPRSGLFPWFDSLGVDALLREFATVRPSIRSWYDIFGSDEPAPEGFVLVASPANETHAIAADESLYRTWRIEESPQGDVSFWAGAIAADFEKRRGYVLSVNRTVTIDGKPGCEIVAETPGDGRGRRYLLLISVTDGSFSDTISITEYAALRESFDVHADAVRKVAGTETSPTK